MQRTISLGRFQTIILACEQILFISLRIVRIVYLSYIYYRTGNVSRDEDAVSRISEFTIASLGDRFTGGFHQSLGFLTWQVYSYQNIDIMLYYKCCIIIINFMYILSWFFVFKFRKKSSLFIKNIPKNNSRNTNTTAQDSFFQKNWFYDYTSKYHVLVDIQT